MTDTVHAIVTRKRGINGQHADGAVILDMPVNQFADWRGMGWVSRATAEQVEAHNEAVRIAAEKAAAEAAKPKKSKAAKPA